ncbi:aromatic compound dioxygenase [Xylariaceae sp. FL1019]|nr:aromatic compound dioxygenase [Xylariaceae sp. FL1019]
MHSSLIVAAFVWLAGLVASHGGSLATEVLKRGEFLATNGLALLHARDVCGAGTSADEASYIRLARDLHEQSNLARFLTQHAARNFTDYDHSHESNDGFHLDTDPHEIFSKYPACALSPDATEGPYYVEGELVRSEIIDGQPGIPLYLKIRVKDIEKCTDVSNVFVEIWHTNATGVYSGVDQQHDMTFCRGLQKTDDMGVVSFLTIFPGHYYGRTPHIHVAVHVDAKQEADNSVHDNTVSMNAQVYFDQDLIHAVEKTSPYDTNTQEFTTNEDDRFLGQEASAQFDPFVYWIPVAKRVEDGLIAWITVGANMTEHRELSVADHRS